MSELLVLVLASQAGTRALSQNLHLGLGPSPGVTNVGKILFELEREYVVWPDTDAHETETAMFKKLIG